MDSKAIRETYLSFFEERRHLRRPSASLVPSAHDPSVLLTTAGMQPLKPYFLGEEEPPGGRLTTCQRCFRTTDIDQVGATARHLTFFEMLGNFSFGDYFKDDAIAFGWELSTGGFGFDPEQIWVTVFEGDSELGLGPDEESIELWRAQGVPEERIVRLPRSENFWQAGPTGPCGPCSEMYLDRGESFGGPGDRPGDDTDRFLEYWNHVFMTFELADDGSLTELPQKNIDTGLGLERMAAISQDVDSVFETDLFRPLLDLAEELSGRSYGEDERTTRAIRIVADHSRGAAELIADGVVPSNEDRGYILRRIMRRAIHQGRAIGIEGPFLGRFAERVIELLGDAHPQLSGERSTIERWVSAEEESFGQTLERGMRLLGEIVERAKESSTSWVDAEDAFRLHDTYGFPYELTKEILAEHGLAVDDDGFEALMERQRERARSGATSVAPDRHEAVLEFVGAAPPTRFVGYETLHASSTVLAAAPIAGEGAEALLKLEESPFYAEGGGQVADQGEVHWNGSRAQVVDVYRVGDDQALRVRADGLPGEGDRVEGAVSRAERYATMRNHTATHLLHAALRERLGTHVRQAGSAVRPDKLRFDFTHTEPLSAEDVRTIEDRVTGWIKQSLPVRAIEMGREEAEALGAMALFGEKYGEWVRVVEVEQVSRELCGGTHVANTAEVGIFAISSEGSSAANVRRIEALTGPAAIDYFRTRDAELREAGSLLGDERDPLGAARRAAERLDEFESERQAAGAKQAGEAAEELVEAAERRDGAAVAVARAPDGLGQRELMELGDRVRSKLGDAVVVLGSVNEGKVAFGALASPALVERGVSASDIVREAAAVTGGGGGGRPDSAQAGGRDPAKLDAALDAARQAIATALQ